MNIYYVLELRQTKPETKPNCEMQSRDYGQDCAPLGLCFSHIVY